jgi:hypothetical protein
VVAVTALAVTAPSASAAGAAHGCPAGYVCIYPRNAGWNHDRPEHRYYTYGAHNLQSELGVHRVFNNQTRDAVVWYCRGYNGTGGSDVLMGSPVWYDDDLTPVNSFVLAAENYGVDAC